MRCNNAMNPYFLVLNIYADYMADQYRSVVGGTTVSHLNVAEVKRIKLLKPDISEQNNIVENVRELDDIINSLGLGKRNLENLRTALLSDLLTGKVRI